jgi:hypothetical protein
MSVPDATPQHPASSQDVDIEKLAEKVYRLLVAELRLERARQGGNVGRR